MIIKTCDKCGGKININPASNVVFPTFEIREMDNFITGWQSVDLCPKCEEKLNGWLNQKEATVDDEPIVSEMYRPKDCPIVEIPTPHGRLIDAERLFNIFEPITSFPKDEQIMYVEAFLTAIKQAPTIIEAEVSE